MPTPIDKCLLCGRESRPGARYIVTDRGASAFLRLPPPYKVLRCVPCHFRWLNPQPTEAEYTELYDDKYYHEASCYFSEDSERKAKFEARLREIRQHLPHDIQCPVLLDVGAGPGDFVHIALKMGFKASGYEVSKFSRQEAERRYGIQLLGEDTLDLQPNTLDVIHLEHVFEHITDPHAYLELFRRGLRPDGLLVIEVPNQFDNLRDRFRRLVPRRYGHSLRYSLHHPVFYTPRSLRSLLEQHHFTPQRIRQYYPYMRLYSNGKVTRLVKRCLCYLSAALGRGILIEVYARPSLAGA